MKPIALVVAGVIVLAISSGGHACGFHTYSPQPTLVDRLISSDQIVLARSSPSNPFQFRLVEPIGYGVGTAPEIPFLVDSNTRKTFQLKQQARVLFARDSDAQTWSRLALVDSDMAPVVDQIVARLPDWSEGRDQDRPEVFAALVNHPNQAVHALALRELDLVDYNRLRNLVLHVDSERLLARLDVPSERDLLPIRILLLGLNKTPGLEERFRKSLAQSLQFETENVGAYATALIELAGTGIVHEITVEHLVNHAFSAAGRETVLQAFALFSHLEDRELKEALSNAVSTALWLDPSLAGAVARQFGAVEDWSHSAALSAVLLEGKVSSAADRADVDNYLRRKPVRSPVSASTMAVNEGATLK